jgi:transposase-like protein
MPAQRAHKAQPMVGRHARLPYRGVSKYHFPMYLKEIEYRFNHRGENLYKQFIKLYFDYDSP